MTREHLSYQHKFTVVLLHCAVKLRRSEMLSQLCVWYSLTVDVSQSTSNRKVGVSSHTDTGYRNFAVHRQKL